MTDDSGADETTEKTDAAPATSGDDDAAKNNKYRLISGESVLKTAKPAPACLLSWACTSSAASSLVFICCFTTGSILRMMPVPAQTHSHPHRFHQQRNRPRWLCARHGLLGLGKPHAQPVHIGTVGHHLPPCHHATPRHHYGGQFDQHGRRLVYFRFQCVRFYSL